MKTMVEHKKLQYLDDYFLELAKRPERAVYFYRINGYNKEVDGFIRRYYEEARRTGVVIEGKIKNPEESNLSYFNEIMGMEFQLDAQFMTSRLKKWLPRMNDYQRSQVAQSICDVLQLMRQEGKSDDMLRNAYIKFMCWLYYKFERIVNQLGSEVVPKILYEGNIGNYELKLLSILSQAGCDIVLLQYQGDDAYRKLDRDSVLSDAYPMTGMTAFEETFSIAAIRKEKEEEAKASRLYQGLPKLMNCTNVWITGEGLDDILTAPLVRGNDENLFYNCFIRINGVEDKYTYTNELYQFVLQLKSNKRTVVIEENKIPVPTVEEIAEIKRSNYNTIEQMLMDLSRNIIYAANLELQKVMVKAFVDSMLDEAKKVEGNINRLTNKAVYLLCYIRRYQKQLFSNWKRPDTPCFIYLGGANNEHESIFLRYLAKLPVDVLVLVPNRNKVCALEDSMLYEITYETSLNVEHFPTEKGTVQMATTAYQAERELDSILYEDSGIYRDRQYNKAVALTLKTMFEEIGILWNQELKYRPNFAVNDGVVHMPVLFAKVSGVKDGNVGRYWTCIKNMVTEDTIMITDVPMIKPTDANPLKAYATEFFKNRRLQREKIKTHPAYQYGILREEIQDYMFDKIELMIEEKMIKGIYENGTEYTVVATALNLNKEMVRLIQKFDFTKKNPKVIYINTTEKIISLEDSIVLRFLNLIGFDVVFFVPNGYQNVENYFNGKQMEEHQYGEYLYDLTVPEFSKGTLSSLRDIIFRKGNKRWV